MTKSKKVIRFDVLSKYFLAVKNGIQPLDAAKSNIQLLGYKIYESEMEKFAAEYPDVDMTEFKNFVTSIDAYSKSGKRGSTGERKSLLNSPEKALAVGVAPENVEEYLQLISSVQPIIRRLNEIITGGRVSFAIPVIKKEKVAP